jgi:hypothetical protein
MNKYIIGIIILIIVVLIYKYYNKTSNNSNSNKNINNDEYDYLLKTEYNLNESKENNTNPTESIYSEKILNIDFVPSNEFLGQKEGFVFKTGEYGLGYYYDQ